MKRSLSIPAVIGVAGMLFAQASLAQTTILDTYIKKGLETNLALHQKSFDLQKAEVDLKRAKTLFYPQASLNSQYTLASGGRTQDIPIGDLLNNVYSTLNQLTGASKFPQVANQKINFLPNDFHDTRLEVSLPLVNTDIYYNKAIKQELIHTQQVDIEIYKRELVKNIKEAYYQYLQAGKAVDIYNNALKLASENLRVSEKFVQNNVGTKESVMRAKAQVSQVKASLITATNQQLNAAAYFNCLLNENLEAPVTFDTTLLERTNTSIPAALEVTTNREELTKIQSAQKVVGTSMKMNRNYLVPKLNAFYDIGFQGYGFKFNSDQFYQLGGLQFKWDLFKANDNKYKIQQSQLDLDALGNQYKDVQQQLNLQVRMAMNNYRSAIQTLEALNDEVQSAVETYRFAERRFREGQALQIELIDARTQLTSAELNYSLAQLAVLTRAAELERATASYKF
ncbi:outer membrane efflux protein [Niastella koreensis GR20-10]|uniref:Outer membrane efflux protein n=2 Tax=Niastella koreensis TaxID=354356 RepID=G8TID8_NIAKG|nr:TolC family protein [Niastella koreensis]AEW01754.1 outer membrane efflux protein [Niastella koreensis GR20-10]